MGFFSWTTSDTNRSVSNAYSNRGTFPVYVLRPDGSAIYEDSYEGYGIFGGEDIFALVARWNEPELCSGVDEEDRLMGIGLAYSDQKNAELEYPIKIVENLTDYAMALPSKGCGRQGYFY